MKIFNSIGINIYTNGNMMSKALSLNTPHIFLDEKYELFIIKENTHDKNYNKMANHIISMLKKPSIFNYGCIYGDCCIFSENENNIINFTKKEFYYVMNEIYKLHGILEINI